jgi:hypothetical protein
VCHIGNMKTYDIVELKRKKGQTPQWAVVWAEKGGGSWAVDGLPCFATEDEAVRALTRIRLPVLKTSARKKK